MSSAINGNSSAPYCLLPIEDIGCFVDSKINARLKTQQKNRLPGIAEKLSLSKKSFDSRYYSIIKEEADNKRAKA